MRTMALVVGLILAGLLGLGTSTASAQATRTWVSGVGDDANPCSRTAPCKTFAGAISKTATSGEINCLDPGGFGAVTITKSISISCSTGTAGVLVPGTNGIVVNAPDGSTVLIEGLDIEGVGTGLTGVSIIGGGDVTIRRCSIQHFTQNGVNVAGDGTARAFVVDSLIIHNGGGLNVNGAAGAANVGLLIRSILDQNTNFAVQVTAPSKLFLAESKLLGSAVGIGNPGGTATVTSFGDNAIGGTGAPTVLNALK